MLTVGIGGFAILLVLAFLAGGLQTAGGVVLAGASCLFSIWGLARLVGLLQLTEPPPAAGVKITLLAGILKLPMVGLGLWLSYTMCRSHIGLLAAAIMLVYFSAVAVLWARGQD